MGGGGGRRNGHVPTTHTPGCPKGAHTRHKGRKRMDCTTCDWPRAWGKSDCERGERTLVGSPRMRLKRNAHRELNFELLGFTPPFGDTP
eukprot:scaffold47_cov334-Pavlova_lutheri.AAC.7